MINNIIKEEYVMTWFLDLVIRSNYKTWPFVITYELS